MSGTSPHPPAFWNGLADAYMAAFDAGRPVGYAVQEYLESNGVRVTHPGTVHAHWIRAARQRGLLPVRPTGKQPLKLQLVAEAIGVETERLAWAVREFANGQLGVR